MLPLIAELGVSQEDIDKIFEMSEYKDQGKQLIVSGCLSERYFNDLKDELPEIEIKAEDYFAIVLQHELDHFKGTLFYDYINSKDPYYTLDNATIIE